MAGSLSDSTPEGVPYATHRTAEIWTAAAAALIGVVVVSESLTHDIGWNETGPGSGYFPFRIGLLLIGAAVVRVLQVRLKAGTTKAFVTREELRRSLSVLWPTIALVAAMIPLGCYVPSAVYLAWMMRRHGGYGWLPSAVYGVAIAVVFFLVFDLWFRVPLAKGPVEAALGLY
jgi:hypothetical protein